MVNSSICVGNTVSDLTKKKKKDFTGYYFYHCTVLYIYTVTLLHIISFLLSRIEEI